MNKRIVWSLFVLCFLASAVFGTIYVNDLNILGPGDTLQFQIYTYANAEKKPVTMSIYKVEDAFSVFLNGLDYNEIESVLSGKEALIHYQIPVDSSWQRESFPLTFFKDLGGYICRLSRDKEITYACVERTDIDGVAIDMGSFINLEIWHSNKGERVSFGDVYTGFDQIYMGSLSDPLLRKIEKKSIKNGLIVIKTPSGNAIVQLDEEDYIKNYSAEMIFLSEKPLYKPGETIQLKGYFYDRPTSKLLDSGTVTMTLTDPMGIKLKEQTCDLDQWGGFEFHYDTVEESVRGHYDFTVLYQGNEFYRYVELSDYQKPEFTVEVENLQDVYSIGKIPQFEIRSDYYYGQPLQFGEVHVKLDLLPDYEKVFSSQTTDIRFTNLTDGVATGTLAMTGEGVENYSVEFTVVDQSGREVSEQRYFQYIPSDVQIKSEKWRYWYEFGQAVNGQFFLKSLDDAANTLNRPLNIEIYRKGNLIVDEVYQTDQNGQINVSFEPILPGYYTMKIIDSQYPKNTMEKTFFVYSSEYSYSTNEKLEIITDKEVYKPSELINLKLISSLHTLHVLAVLDFGNSVVTKDIRINGYSADLSFVIPADMTRNAINIRFVSYFAGERISMDKNIPVLLDSHLLNITLDTEEKVQPGDQVAYQITLTDAQNIPVNGIVTLNVIDQSLLDLYGDDDWREVLLTLENPPFNYYFEYFNNCYYINRDQAHNQLPYDTPDTLAQTKSAATGKSVKVRSDFSDSALWLPAVIVNGKLQSEFKLPESLTTWNLRTIGFTADGKRGYASRHFISTLPVTVNEIFPKFLISGDEVELGVNLGNYSGEELTFQLVFEGPSIEENREIVLSDKEQSIQWFRYKVPQVHSKETVKFQISAVSDSFSDAMVKELPVHPEDFTKQLGYAGIITREGVEQTLNIQVPSEVRVRVSANLEAELINALEYLIGYPYGCTEQTVSSFLPSLAFMKLNQDLAVGDYSQAFKKVPDITQALLKRLYSYQNYEGGWGWWRDGQSDPFMTAYVLYTFYKLKQMDIEINQQSFSRGQTALKGLLESSEKALPFSEYIMALLDPSYTIVLTNQQSTSSKLFLGLVMLERNQNELARSILEDLLKTGTEVGGIFKISFDRTSYFINDLMLNALLFELIIKTGYEGEQVNGLFRYLYTNKTGSFWSSTKDTAFVVMALSHYVFEGTDLEFSVKKGVIDNETEWVATGVIAKGQMKDFTIPVVAPTNLNLSLSGSGGLLWEIGVAESWNPLDQRLADTHTQEHFVQRTLEVKRDVTVIDAKGKVTYDSLYIPIKSEIKLGMVVESGAEVPNQLQPVKIESFSIQQTSEDYWSALFVNNCETGLRIPEDVKLIGMDATSLIFDRNPFSYDEGKFRFFFEINKKELMVGDEIRSTIQMHFPVDYHWVAIEEYLPVCFVQNEQYMDNYYFGKYFSSRYYLWSYYLSNIEKRYDRTSLFFEFLDEGFSIYQNHYKVVSAGEFLVPPLRLFQMYEVGSDCVAPGLTIQVNSR